MAEEQFEEKEEKITLGEIDRVLGKAGTELKLLSTNVVTTKMDIVRQVGHAILAGYIEPAKAGVVLKRIKEGVEAALKIPEIKDAIILDTQKYLEGSKKTAIILGAKCTLTSTYTTYSFKDCNDIYLMKLYEIQEQVKAEIKLREDALKLLLKEQESKMNKGGFGVGSNLVTKDEIIKLLPKIVLEDNGGEVVTLHAPVKIQNIGIKYSQI